MTDLQDIRSRLRDDVRRGSSSSSDEGGGGGNYTLVIIGCGLIIGLAVFMFVPRFFQSSGTATIRDTGNIRIDTRITDGGRYTGKSPDEAAALADEVCAVRAPGKVAGKPPRLGDSAAEFLTPEGMKRVH